MVNKDIVLEMVEEEVERYIVADKKYDDICNSIYNSDSNYFIYKERNFYKKILDNLNEELNTLLLILETGSNKGFKDYEEACIECMDFSDLYTDIQLECKYNYEETKKEIIKYIREYSR